MPELPEVETIRAKLDGVLPGNSIVDVTVFKEKSFQGNPKKIINKKINKIKRKGKILIIPFENKYFLLIHLKMTGQVIVSLNNERFGGGHPTADWVSELPTKHTRVLLSFRDGMKLYFNDMRIFGWMKVASLADLDAEFKNYGPDINTSEASTEYLIERLSRRRISIKQAIMMNSIISGVGNIYACDALNMARISPFREANSLSEKDVNTLLSSMKSVINTGIAMGGATIEDYVDVDGFAGKYQEVVLTYGRKDMPCKNCGGTIVKEKLGGRGTYYCPNCQI